MKINTIETKGMKFSREVGAPATQWVPLCCKLFPPKWFHASVSAASATITTTGNNKTRDNFSAKVYYYPVMQILTVCDTWVFGASFLCVVYCTEAQKHL